MTPTMSAPGPEEGVNLSQRGSAWGWLANRRVFTLFPSFFNHLVIFSSQKLNVPDDKVEKYVL